MPFGFFDTHTHLDAVEFESDRLQVIDRARQAGISRFLTVGASRGFDSAEAAIALANQHPDVWASVGVHPHDAGLPCDLERLRDLALQPRVQAIGETGLDFYRDWAPVESQKVWFKSQIQLALELNKPLIIHSRAAAQECLQMLIDFGASAVGGVFHCFSEDAEFAAKLWEINFLISVPGVVTFKNAQALREALNSIPLEQIMLETDAPYLAPVPHRGKRCESSFLVDTAQALAKIKGISLEEIAKFTTQNALRLFKIDA
ncbi:MAG: TatD family hydrolase [Bdellovibrionales bacterium]|nr:TatD family hydrolase [Bdellovibrionales bacterium]